MYRLQQQLVSWVCGQLAQIAEIDPENVAPSLMKGSIELSNVTLRVATLNKLLPVKLDHGTIGCLSVSVPWLTRSVQPLEITLSNAVLVLAGEPQEQTAHSRSIDELLMGITAERVLGVTPPNDSVSELSHSRKGADPSASTAASDDDDDFHSCKSDSDAESLSSDDDDDHGQSQKSRSVVKSVFSAVARYIAPAAWTAPRTVRLLFSECQIVYPCDARHGLSLCAAVDRFVVEIQPNDEASPNCKIRVVNITLEGTSIAAREEMKSHTLMAGDRIDITITTTTDSSGGTLATNVSVDQKTSVDVMLSESAVKLLSKCLIGRAVADTVPSYAREFLPLRRKTSWWPYACACALANVRDRRKRWNFNLSHLRVFSTARRSYLDLLDVCHRREDVEDSKNELAHLEHDLVYEDVIDSLREISREKFHKLQRYCQPLVSSSEEQSSVVISTHVYFAKLQLHFPHMAALQITAIRAVVRTDDVAFELGSIRMHHQAVSADFLMCSCVENPSTPFLKVSWKVDGSRGMQIISFEFQDVSGHTNPRLLLESIRPVASCVMLIQQAYCRPALGSPAALPTGVQRKVSVVGQAHFVRLHVEEFCFNMSKFSVSHTSALDQMPAILIGCTELFIAHKGTYVLDPISVHTEGRTVLVGSVRFSLTDDMERDALRLRDIIQSELHYLAADVRYQYPRHESEIVLPTSRSPCRMLRSPARKKVVRGSLSVCFEGVDVHIASLQLQASLKTITVKAVEHFSDSNHVIAGGCAVELQHLYMSLDGSDSGLTLDISSSTMVDVLSPRDTSAKSQLRVVLGSVTVALREATDPLVLIPQCHVIACDGELQLEAATFFALGKGISLSPLKVTVSPNAAAVANEFGPYHASNVTLVANIDHVRIQSILESSDVARLITFVWGVAVPAAQRVMSVRDQRLFQNGLSNLFLHLSCSARDGDGPMRIDVNEGASMYALITCTAGRSRRGSRWSNRSATDAGSPGLGHEHRGLSSVIAPTSCLTSSAVTILNDCATLAVKIDVSALCIQLSPSCDFPEHTVDVAMESLSVLLPMTRLDFWSDPATLLLEPPSSTVELAALTVSVGKRHEDDCIWNHLASSGHCLMELCFENVGMSSAPGLKYHSRDSSDTESSDHVMWPSEEFASVPNSSKFRCASARVLIDIDDASAVASSISTWRTAVNACAVKHAMQRITVSQHGVIFSDTIGGAIHVSASSRVVVIDDCTFDLRRPIVIEPWTSCVLRRCSFRCLPHHFSPVVVCSNDSASVVMDDCTVGVADVSENDRHPQQNIDGPSSVVVDVDCFIVSCRLRPASSELHIALRRLCTTYTQSDALFRATFQVNEVNAHCRVHSNPFTITTMGSLFVDAKTTLGNSNYLAVFARLNTEVIRIPLHLAHQVLKFLPQFLSAVSNGESAGVDALHRPNGVFNVSDIVEKWSWKIDFSIPSLEICCSLANGLPVLTASTHRFLVSSHRSGVGDPFDILSSSTWRVAAWDSMTCKNTDIFGSPLTLSLKASLNGNASSLKSTIEVSKIALVLNDEIISSVLALPKHLSRSHQQAPLRIVNQLGCPLLLTLPGVGKPICVKQSSLEEQYLRFELPFSFQLPTMDSFILVETLQRSACSRFLHSEIYIHGGLCCLVELEIVDSFCQVVTFGSMVRITNHLPDCSVVLTNNLEGLVVAPSQSQTIPITWIDCPNVEMHLKGAELESERKGFFGSTPRAFGQRVLNEGGANLSQRLDFESSGLSSVVDMVVSMDHDRMNLLTICFVPRRPTFLNHLYFPVTLLCDEDQSLGMRLTVAAGGSVVLYHNVVKKDFSSNIWISVSLPSGDYISSEAVNIDSTVIGGEEVAIVMWHREKGAAQYFELALAVHWGDTSPLVSLVGRGFVLSNMCGLPLLLCTDLGAPVGTSGDVELSTHSIFEDDLQFAPMKLECDSLLPLEAPLLLQPYGSVPSEDVVFSVSDSQRTVLCSIPQSNGVLSELGEHCLCLHRLPQRPPAALHLVLDSVTAKTLESDYPVVRVAVLPSTLFINDSGHSLEIRHSIVAADGRKVENSVVVGSGERCCYLVVGKAGNTEYFQLRVGTDEVFSVPFRLPTAVEGTSKVVVECCGRYHSVTMCRNTQGTITILVGPQRQSLVYLVNMSYVPFDEVRSHSIAQFNPPPYRTSFQLTPLPSQLKSQVFDVPLKGSCTLIVDELHIAVSTKIFRDRIIVTVVDGAVTEKATAPVQLSSSVDVFFGGLLLTVISCGHPLAQVIVDGMQVAFSNTLSSCWSLQMSVTKFSVANSSNISGTGPLSIVDPVDLSFIVRDALLDVNRRQLLLDAVKFHVNKVSVRITDILLKLLSDFGARCTYGHSTVRVVDALTRLPVDVASNQPVRVMIKSIVLSEIALSLTWKRNSTTSENDVLNQFFCSHFIKSVTDASLKFPLFARTFAEYCDANEVAASITQQYLRAIVQQSWQLLSSHDVLGAPLSWAGSLISGVSYVFGSDFVRRSVAAPISLFSSVEEQPEPSQIHPQKNSWLCSNCVRVHADIERGLSLREVLRLHGEVALAHHTSQRERAATLGEAKLLTGRHLLSLSVDFSGEPVSSPELLPLAPELQPEFLATHFPLYQLCAFGMKGDLPPFTNEKWHKILEIATFMRSS